MVYAETLVKDVTQMELLFHLTTNNLRTSNKVTNQSTQHW